MNLARWLSRGARALPAAVALLMLGLAPAPAGAAAAPGTAARGTTAPALVVLGDSLSAGYGIHVEDGWVALLERRLEAQGYGYRVVNASVSGETTAGGLARLPHILGVHHPAVIIIELGANDGLRGLPVAELRRNLAALVDQSRTAGARVLVVGTRLPSNYGSQYTDAYFRSFAAVAKAGHVALVPSLLEGLELEDRNFQADRKHPVAAAQPALLATVWRGLEPLLGPPRHAREPSG